MPNFNKEIPKRGINNIRNGNIRTEFIPRLSAKASSLDEDLNGNSSKKDLKSNSHELSKDAADLFQGQDLIQTLPKYVGSDGLIKSETDLGGYAELMQSENTFSHRLLLLKILVATLKSDGKFSGKLIECESILVLLSLWLNEVENEKLHDSILVEKILEILSRLDFTIDLLIKFKFGRFVKKIVQQNEKSGATKLNATAEIASKLFEKWSILANQPELPSIPRRKSEDTSIVQSYRIEESSEEAKCAPQKRLKIESDEVSDLNKKNQRSVHFPEDDDKLCKIIVFERAPEEYAYLSDGSEARDNYLHADAGEASIMFNEYSIEDEEEEKNFKCWEPLKAVKRDDNCLGEGNESEETIIQHQRERTVLSAKYYNIDEVPLSPSEEGVDFVDDDSGFKLIPVKANEKISVRQFSIKNNSASIVLPPELLNNFLSSSASLTNFLNPFANATQYSVKIPESKNFLDSFTPAAPVSVSKPESHNFRPVTHGYSSKSLCRFYRPGKPQSCRFNATSPLAQLSKMLTKSRIQNRFNSFFNFSVVKFNFSNVLLDETKAENITELERLKNLRNIGISAHIDSGKTTLTERILYYTGRIKSIHEVRGKDGVGAKMDSMELEREKGITIKSAATYCHWKNNRINIIDTPGHVDFTIEVERALRVLDSAILVLCGVSGVQSQTITVDRQMRRYNVPRIAFINKLDRMGANPFNVIEKLRHKLKHNAAAIQIPVGSESNLRGLIDLVKDECYLFSGDFGEKIERIEIPTELSDAVKARKQELLESLANVDDEMADHLLNETFPSPQELKAAIRRCTINRKFLPVMMGSAYKNVGVQLLLDGVADYLPNPNEVENTAVDLASKETKTLPCRSDSPFVGLAFKLEESRFGQLTYVRVYQGKLTKGAWIHNVVSNKKVKVPRLVRMHSDEMEDIDEVGAGEICAMFGVECSSGDTFTDGQFNVSMTPMHVPDPVISLSIKPVAKDQTGNFSKALARFQKEDPTFRVHIDLESGETIISGMGELHLEIYVERMKREYNCPCITGKPQVAFRETIQGRAEFNYTHKKQSGGAGQFARVSGYIEPIRNYEDGLESSESGSNIFANEFVSKVVGGAVPTEFIPACEKGFLESALKGFLIGHPFVGIRFVLEDGSSHVVDSNEFSFRTASASAFRKACESARPIILEPIMKVSVVIPVEFQGAVMGNLNKRRALILDSETQEETLVMIAEVPLNAMFGYSTELRSLTQGKGEFSMEYKTHKPILPSIQTELVDSHRKKQGVASDKK